MKRKCYAAGLALAAIVAAGTCSCSVKEDRSGCPCWASVLFKGVYSEPVTARFIDSASGDITREFGSICLDEDGRMYLSEGEVPRLNHEIIAFCGSGGVGEDGVISASLGCEIDSVSIGHSFIDTRGESAEAVVVMNRQYCEIRVRVLGAQNSLYPYSFRVSGNTCGVTVRNGNPVPGPFEYYPTMKDGSFTVNVPRQADDSLELVVIENLFDVGMIPLGLLIIRSGYDWTRPSLEPISVELDYSRSGCTVVISEWASGAEGMRFEI